MAFLTLRDWFLGSWFFEGWVRSEGVSGRGRGIRRGGGMVWSVGASAIKG